MNPRGAPHAIGIRLSLMFAALFVIHGVSLTYLPVWLDARGLTAAQIALATSAPTFLRLVVTPAIAIAADRAQAHRSMILLLSWSGLALMLALSQLQHPAAIVVLVIAMLIAVQSIMPLADTITMRAVRDHDLDYGRVRLWGSASFILASYFAGYAAAGGGAQTIIWMMAAGAALTTASGYLLPGSNAAAPTSRGLTPAGIMALMSDRGFVLFAVGASVIQASHALFYVFGVLHWRAQGISPGVIGSLWGISVVAEIVLFWASRRVGLVGPIGLIALGAGCGIVRWTAMAFDPPVALLFPLQVLHAGSFAATHLGAMHWIAKNVPDGQAGTAQALLSAAGSGIGMGGAILLSGSLYPLFGGAAYLAMAVMCCLGGLAALASRTMPPLR